MNSSEQTQVVNLQTQTTETQTAPVTAAPTTPEAPKTDPKQDSNAAKFAALARRERANRDIQKQIQQREQLLKQKEQEILEREQRWNSEFRESPLEALRRRGIEYKDLTEAALNDGKFQPDIAIKEVKSELQKLREEQATREQKILEQQKLEQEAAAQETINAFRERITSHIDANSEKYELTKLYDASDMVYQTVEKHYEETKKLITLEEACDLVEQYLESELERTTKESKKFQSKYLNKPKEEPKPQQKSSTTLSNSIPSSSAPSMLPAATENDRLKRALAALG